jgi:hypothetical protein
LVWVPSRRRAPPRTQHPQHQHPTPAATMASAQIIPAIMATVTPVSAVLVLPAAERGVGVDAVVGTPLGLTVVGAAVGGAVRDRDGVALATGAAVVDIPRSVGAVLGTPVDAVTVDDGGVVTVGVGVTNGAGVGGALRGLLVGVSAGSAC